MCAHLKARGWHQVSSSAAFHPMFWPKPLSLNPELCSWLGWPVSSTTMLGLWCMTHTWLYVCAGHLNSGPHAWAASTLSSQPSFRLLNVLISFYNQRPQQTFQPASTFSPTSHSLFWDSLSLLTTIRRQYSFNIYIASVLSLTASEIVPPYESQADLELSASCYSLLRIEL